MSKNVAVIEGGKVSNIVVMGDGYGGPNPEVHPWTVIGQPVKEDGALIDTPPPTCDAVWSPKGQKWEVPSATFNACIDAKIAALEAKQLRPLREYARLNDQGSLDRIIEIDDAIAELRKERKVTDG